MTNRTACLAGAVMSSCLLLNRPAHAEEMGRSNASDWSRVMDLERGDAIEVRVRDGSRASGMLLGVDSRSITVLDSLDRNEDLSRVGRVIRKEDVAEIRHGKKSAKRKLGGVVLGVLVGYFGGSYVGAGIDYALSPQGNGGEFSGYAYGAAIGAPVGAVLGLVIAKGNGGKILYDAPEAISPSPLGAALSPSGRGGGVPATNQEMTPRRREGRISDAHATRPQWETDPDGFSMHLRESGLVHTPLDMQKFSSSANRRRNSTLPR